MNSVRELVRFKFGDRGYTVFARSFNNYMMVHIRMFYEDGKPTGFGVVLTTLEWNILINKLSNKLNSLIEQMQEALKQGGKHPKSKSFYVGFRGFSTSVTETHGALYVRVHKFDGDGKPTTIGVALTIEEWQDLLHNREYINKIIADNKSEAIGTSQEPQAKKQCVERSQTEKRLFKSTLF
jgi:hypothetical protein